MKHCPDLQEDLWLDIYGELPPEKRLAWDRHLETCSGCRKERQRMLRLLELIREASPSAALSPERFSEIQGSIRQRLMKDRAKTWWRQPFSGISLRPMHALAAACLLIVALGWLSLREFQSTSSVRTASNLKVEEQMIAQDLELIENLELLEEMDVLEKVVQVVDQRKVSL